jgi:hypothetical protein
MAALNQNIVELLVFSAFAACLVQFSIFYLLIPREKYKF